MNALLAQFVERGPVVAGAGGIGGWVIGLLIFAAVVVIGWIILTRGIGFVPPPWVVQIFWVVVALVVGILAIRIVLSL